MPARDFNTEESPSYGGQRYTSSTLNKVYLRKIEDNVYQFSENGGLRGMSEVMGICRLHKISKTQTRIVLKFRMGIFPIILPFYLLLVALLIGVIGTVMQQMFGIVMLGVSLFIFVLFLIKRYSVKFILEKFSEALKIDNSWMK
ncbi:hypothetical protein OAO55_01150 [Bacteroidales bacterium]|nr:hypothetical protein [Bacteroidales bacterium]